MFKGHDFRRSAIISFLVLAVAMSGTVLAVKPDWSPPSGVRMTMTVHAVVVKADGELLAAPDSMLAALKGDEVQGVATAFEGDNGVSQFQLSVGSNEALQSGLSLCVYDASLNTVFEAKEDLDFVSDTTLGTIGNPIELHTGERKLTALVTEREGDPPGAHATRWGFRLASAIPIKPHLHDRSTCQYDALSRYLAMGMLDEAIEEAGEIKNWRRGVLLTDIAVAYAHREGLGLMMRHFLDLAAIYRDSLDGMNAGWQKERINGHIALALARAGLFDEAKQAAAGIQDAVVSKIIIEECGGIKDEAGLTRILDGLAKMAKSVHFEHKESAALGYIRILENANPVLSQSDKGAVLEALEAVPEHLPAALQCKVQCAAARAGYKVGDGAFGLSMLQSGMRSIAVRTPHANIDVRNYVDLALAYSECAGNAEKAAVLINKATALLEDGKSLTRTERANATLALASGQWRLGYHDVALDLFSRALAVAQTQVNGRPRFKMLVSLCLTASECGVELPEAIQEALAEEYDQQGDPW